MAQTLQELFTELFGRPPREGELDHPFYVAQLRRFGADGGLFTAEQLAQSSVLMAFPHIMDEDGNLYYGGDQGWYGESIAKPHRSIESFSGCGVVSAVDNLVTFAYSDEALAARMDIKFYVDGSVSKTDFLKIMNLAYREMGTMELPGYAGRYQKGRYRYEEKAKKAAEKKKRGPVPPSLGIWGGRYIKGTVGLARRYSIKLAPHAFSTLYADYDDGLKFIKSGIAAGSCVDIFTTFNAHEMTVWKKGYGILSQSYITKNIQHHVVAVAAYDMPGKDDCEIIVSSWGRLASISYRALHASWQSSKAVASGLYYFTETNSDEKARAALRKNKGGTLSSAGRIITKRPRKKM